MTRRIRIWRIVVLGGAVLLAVFIGVPLTLIVSAKRWDRRQRADVIVVFGARTYADGTPSLSLADRVRTACQLYHAGYAPVLYFSGGPGDGVVHETEAMRRLAIEMGVPAQAIYLDRDGLDTRATVRHATAFCQAHGYHTVLAVSQFYHLPRIRLAFHRAEIPVATVPALETRPLRKIRYFVAREVVVWWSYALFG